jgi:hypothetical protein
MKLCWRSHEAQGLDKLIDIDNEFIDVCNTLKCLKCILASKKLQK